MIRHKIVWAERHDGKIVEIFDRKPDYSNDDLVIRPTLQKVRVWLEPLGKETPAKVRNVVP